ncbi:NADH-quinone oxidoreductase subunit L [Ekhidna sp.]|uniref:NADH-quinone oxidoreductase subunit 5 family protein n=1 Tax=Ekhidna sp. TaxID=2608089 RepID=UPI003B50DFE9
MTILILFLPLVGGLVTYLSSSKKYTILSLGIGFFLSLFLSLSASDFVWQIEWLPKYEIALAIDNVSAVLICVVYLISLLVQIFSIEYMSKDKGIGRYYAKLGFFTFSMIGLLMADHLILLFVFWELVGLASYLLIGFWYQREGVPTSAKLAFMVNRIADVALLAGILLINASGSLQISELNITWAFLPSILIAIGAFGKSAQLPFSGWLTKAMVGPTPVSALIHAATMVAAGVYLLFRVAPFLHPMALTIVAFIGALTALFGGLSALFQNDIKKVLAYSTISQLGYMVLGIGVGGASASVFHLFTHAFFKAGLFLGAGAIIHFMHETKVDGQDMRNMGGLKKQLPWTFKTFLVCSFALAGLPFFSGFMSKEGIILAAWEWADQQGIWGYIVSDIALITAFLTALYVGRMILLVFFGEERAQFSMKITERFALKMPLIILAIGSLWIFYNWNPLAHESWLSAIWSNQSNHAESMVITLLSVLMVSSGLFLSYGLFNPKSSYSLNYATHHERFSMLSNGFYLTHSYELFGKFMIQIAHGLQRIDLKVIDGVVHFIGVGVVVFSKTIALVDRFVVDGPVNAVAYLSGFIGRRLAGLSSINIQTQLAWLLVGVLLILSWILFL